MVTTGTQVFPITVPQGLAAVKELQLVVPDSRTVVKEVVSEAKLTTLGECSRITGVQHCIKEKKEKPHKGALNGLESPPL